MYRQPVMGIDCIDLVLSPQTYQKWQEKNQNQYSHLPEPYQMVTDFQELGRRGGVPAIVLPNKKGEAMLLLYTSSSYLAVYATSQGDGYRISHIEPLDLREHERLSKGILMLQIPYWSLYQEAKQLPGRSNQWNKIQNEWRALEMRRRQASVEVGQEVETLTPAHENYLNTLSTLIEVTHKLEQDRHKLPTLIPYCRVESAGEERYARDIYIFHLAGTPQVDKKNMVRLTEAPDLQGRIFDLKENKLTIKFENAIDRARIPNQGNFEPIVSGAIYRTQQEAIETLREGESKNKHLLHVLVDRHYQSYQYENSTMPGESLNREQLDAFRRALTIPDLLLVLGPPGTGKTRTITEIAHQCGIRHQRVLITSQTHKAVDNVLERLPDTLLVVRFGHEDRISDQIRRKLIDEQAKDRRDEILQRTAANNDELAGFAQKKSALDQRVHYLATCIEQMRQNEQHLHAWLQARAIAEQRIQVQYKPAIDGLGQSLQQQQAELSHQRAQVDTWTKKRTTAEGRGQYPLVGSFFRWQTDQYQSRIEAGLQLLNEIQSACVRTHQEYSSLQNQLARTHASDPEYQRCIATISQIEANSSQIREEATKVVSQLQNDVQGLVPTPPPLAQHNTQTLQQYATWFNKTRSLLETRAKLLQGWRKELESRTDQLIPELLRYADVVGATCIGVATAKGLADIEFDLAIVDEAGQISLPDLLVPLVRAKRSILVGDHQQLPPFVDSEVQTWLDGLSPQTQQELGLTDEEIDSEYITELLTKSTFEQLFTERPNQAHMVRFTEQHRMPQVIADFASHHFYENQLRTSDGDKLLQVAHNDPLFRRPLAFIDTSSMSFKDRKETKRIASENWGIEGFTNQLEAALIAHIAASYEQVGMEWGVIVPYRAQSQLIMRELRNRIGTPNFKLEDRVNTVDSFQGRERDRVIYGFTRSNSYGGIGFLKELRRLNVAMTRAKRQLVLVGDLSTLTQAKDENFRHVALSLQTYVQQHGELLSYEACHHRLLPNS